jgi:maltose/maltodextrin transport system substrate-binding protein
MPNIPAMGRFWSAMEAALQNATNGQTDPKSALDNAKQNILQK